MADIVQSLIPSKRKVLTADRLRQVLSYNPDTGVFTRLDAYAKDGPVGTCSVRKDRQTASYLKIGVDGTQYYAHRLAWLYVYGSWPSLQVDHINGDGLDNRLCNLRLANDTQNRTNSLAQRHSKTKLRGVHFHHGAKKYRAQICRDHKTIHLGYFDTAEHAYAAYLRAAAKLHGEFVRWPHQQWATR